MNLTERLIWILALLQQLLLIQQQLTTILLVSSLHEDLPAEKHE